MRPHLHSAWLIVFALAGCTASAVDEAAPRESALASSMLVKNHRAVRDDRATALRVEHWTFLSREECERRGLAGSCAKVCSAPDSRTASGDECGYRSFNRAVLDPSLFETGYVCTEDRCVAAAAALRTPSVLQLYEPRTGGNAYDVEVAGGVRSSSVFGVIPPFIWDWVTGGVCCDDCWATHRSWGLACYMDYACCAGACGVQPGCDDGGGGGGGGGGAGGGGDGGDTGGTDGDSCGASYQTEGASVTYMGQSCSFDGEVNPTWIDGECVPVAGEGTIYDCVGDTGGGIDYTPPETEDTGI